jgi:hypothetical protein
VLHNLRFCAGPTYAAPSAVVREKIDAPENGTPSFYLLGFRIAKGTLRANVFRDTNRDPSLRSGMTNLVGRTKLQKPNNTWA